MAESVTPRTPRQAAEACRTCGDSGLVPNGLASNGPDPCPHCVPLTEWADAKAEPRYETDPFAREAGLEAAGDALAVLVPQLLDQLEGAQEKNDRQAVTVTQAYDKCMALRAALNEIAERDSVVLMGRPRVGVLGKVARAALGDPKETDG